MNVHSAPIGVFDSGLGGLSVALEIQELLPREQLLYAADSRFCPYGSRDSDEILERSRAMVGALHALGAKLIVIACNTATAVALEALRAEFALPIVGLEPAVKPAVALTRNGRIGLLATERTASSARLETLISRYGNGVSVEVMPAPGLVELVESGETEGEHAEHVLRTLVEPMIERGADTLVLGCTHYPFLRSAIQRLVGEQVNLVDSGPAIARRTADLLDLHELAAPSAQAGSLSILTTGDVDQVAETVKRLLGRSVPVAPLSDDESYPAALVPKLSSVCVDSNSAGA